MRRLLCFLLYALMIGVGGAGLVTVFLNYDGRIAIRFIGACLALFFFGVYLLFDDFLPPAKRRWGWLVFLSLALLAGIAAVLRIAAPLPDATAAYQRGDYATALRVWQPLADQGHVGAQFNLGVMYYSGKGVPQNYIEALKWYSLAAEKRSTDAQFNLGVMYANGQGTPQDNVQAYVWFNLVSTNELSGKEARDKAVQNLELITSKMTPAQIATAQKLIAEWRQFLR